MQAASAGANTAAPSIAGTNAGGALQEEAEAVLPPLYLTEFVLEPNQISFVPEVDDYQEGVMEVIKEFQECVLGVENLVPDTYFDAFTRWLIVFTLAYDLNVH